MVVSHPHQYLPNLSKTRCGPCVLCSIQGLLMFTFSFSHAVLSPLCSCAVCCAFLVVCRRRLWGPSTRTTMRRWGQPQAPLLAGSVALLQHMDEASCIAEEVLWMRVPWQSKTISMSSLFVRLCSVIVFRSVRPQNHPRIPGQITGSLIACRITVIRPSPSNLVGRADHDLTPHSGY